MKTINLATLIIITALFACLPVMATAEDYDTDHSMHSDHNKGDESDEKHDKHSDHEKGDESGEKHDDHDEDVGGEHEEHGGHDEHDEGAVKLTPEQMKASGIVVKPLQLKKILQTINASGEVAFNTYKTVSISPLITAQLVKHLVVLGDTVHKGQAVAMLSSVGMAKAQGEILIADKEWNRTKKLGRKIVSERRYLDARASFELAKAKVLSYGMSKSAVKKLLKSADFSHANGHFTLESPINGRVLSEHFYAGQKIESGDEINIITDEENLWVNANIAPQLADQIKVGNRANVFSNGKSHTASVSQISHLLDEGTRTIAVRLSVQNRNDALHPGQFVETRIETINEIGEKPVLALPEAAVIRSPDGDWQVFVEQDEPGEFKGVEVELLSRIAGQAIIKGIKPETRVIFQGAFFVRSELAKSGFSVHNH